MTRILSLIGVVLVVGCGPPPELLESYYDNGQLMVRGIYRDGVPEGLNETYHENGVVVQKGTYKDGEKCGEWLEGSRSVTGPNYSEEVETVTYDPC